jgi:hypothetical protein
MISCDTLNVPLYSSIKIDASVVDIKMRVDFDSSQLRLLDITSALTGNECVSQTGGVKFRPSLSFAASPYGGQAVTMKNFCGIDSTKPFAVLRFVTTNNNRASSRLTIDSINFDTEDVILYKLIATGDRGTILALKSEIAISQPVAFDSVRILECAERSLTVVNTGDVPNAVTELLDLPQYTTLVGSVPPLGDSVRPGDSVVVTLRFCPLREQYFQSAPRVVSGYPCDVRDTTDADGWGYAPELDVALLPTSQFFVPATFAGAIGDTIDVPVMLDKDISATYNGVEYFLNGLNFDLAVTYAPRALKYIGLVSAAEPANTTVTDSLGRIDIAVRGADTLRSGPLATLRFVVAVPDSVNSSIDVTSGGYTSDSLQFLDIVPRSGASPVSVAGRCNISVVKFAPTGRPRIQIAPQPAADMATVSFRMQETVPVFLDVVDPRGMNVRTVLDGSVTLSGGEYSVRFDTADLPSGMYVLRITAGVFVSSVPFVIAK